MLNEPIIPTINVEKIMSIFYYEFANNFYNYGEVHDYWEIVYVDKGEVSVTAGDKKLVISQGQAVFHKPNEFHNITANHIVAPNVFIISFECRSDEMKYFEEKVLNIPKKLRKIITLIIEETNQTCHFPLLMNQMRQDEFYKIAPKGSMQMIKLYLEQFLILLLRQDESAKMQESFDEEDSRGELVRKIISYLEDHIYQDFSVYNLCCDFNYSKAYLCKIFKRTTGRSILEYYINLKMIEARRMIREGTLNIAQIAQRLGYESPQYFSRSFKHVVGMGPQEYKNSVFK